MDKESLIKPSIEGMMNKSVTQWTFSERVHIASEYMKLQQRNKALEAVVEAAKNLIDGCNATSPNIGIDLDRLEEALAQLDKQRGEGTK